MHDIINATIMQGIIDTQETLIYFKFPYKF
jgi:hypothetical protein